MRNFRQQYNWQFNYKRRVYKSLPSKSSRFEYTSSKSWIHFRWRQYLPSDRKAYLQYDITILKVAHPDDDGEPPSSQNPDLIDRDQIRRVNIASAYTFREGKLTTNGGSDLEHNLNVGHVSTVMSLISNKGSGLSSNFDKTNISEDESNNTSLKQILNNKHHLVVNKGKRNSVISFENFSGFCKTIEKITTKLGLHPRFRTADLQENIYILLAYDISVRINKLNLYVPIIIPSAETQTMFNEIINTVLF